MALRKRRSRQGHQLSSARGHSKDCKVMGPAECVCEAPTMGNSREKVKVASVLPPEGFWQPHSLQGADARGAEGGFQLH